MSTTKDYSTPVTCDQICTCLSNAGIRSGYSLVVHSSMKSFGTVDGGAETVIEALMKSVGPEGLIVMPVYASSLDPNGDLLRHPSPGEKVSTGILPSAFGSDCRTFLADHPMYAYAFYGRDAARLAWETEALLMPYGPDQPLTCLFSRRGYIVQIGVDDHTNTSIHVAEELADPPYLAEKKSVSHIRVEDYFLLPLEIRRDLLARHRAGPRRDFSICTPLIKNAGLRTSARVGRATVRVTDFSGMCELLTDAIRKNPSLMISENP